MNYKSKWENHPQRFYKKKINEKRIEIDLASSKDKVQSIIKDFNLPKKEIESIEKINIEYLFNSNFYFI